MNTPVCSECGSTMAEGFIPDFIHAGGRPMLWLPGTPEEKRVLGLKVGGGVVEVDQSEALPVTTYRCTECGFLKSFASSAS
jgi:hypothetical protein